MCNSSDANLYNLNNISCPRAYLNQSQITGWGDIQKKIDCILDYKHAICHQCDTPAFNLY